MDEFTVAANSWRYGNTFMDGLIYFTYADYDDSPDVFNSVSNFFGYLLANLLSQYVVCLIHILLRSFHIFFIHCLAKIVCH